jgi:hypothetical protein
MKPAGQSRGAAGTVRRSAGIVTVVGGMANVPLSKCSQVSKEQIQPKVA